ncbi:MAG: hypothetical protein JXR56_06020 [Candidatus Cloacimonetes bacterium]|nr:hypothetical protein [Candidatus Cloacimonadota bacterium]
MNELSINSQFASVQEFIESCVPPLVSVLNEVDQTQDLLYKKYEFYAQKVTPEASLYDALIGQYSNQRDLIRKFKSQLAALFEDPYWEDSPKHTNGSSYTYNEVNVVGSSLAESCERDRVVISLQCLDYNANVLNVSKNGELIKIDNLYNTGHYETIARERGLLDEFTLAHPGRYRKTRYISQGQSVYREIPTGYLWCLDNLHRDHYEVYNANGYHIGESDLEGNLDSTKKVNGRRI